MVVKYKIDGVKIHGPPYTPREENELYAAMAAGPHRHASAIRQVQPSPQEPTQQEEKPKPDTAP